MALGHVQQDRQGHAQDLGAAAIAPRATFDTPSLGGPEAPDYGTQHLRLGHLVGPIAQCAGNPYSRPRSAWEAQQEMDKAAAEPPPPPQPSLPPPPPAPPPDSLPTSPHEPLEPLPLPPSVASRQRIMPRICLDPLPCLIDKIEAEGCNSVTTDEFSLAWDESNGHYLSFYPRGTLDSLQTIAKKQQRQKRDVSGCEALIDLVRQKIDESSIEQGMKSLISRMNYAYQRLQTSGFNFSANATISFHVDRGGSVQNVHVKFAVDDSRQQAGADQLAKEIVKILKGGRFQRPTLPGGINAEYPLNFSNTAE